MSFHMVGGADGRYSAHVSSQTKRRTPSRGSSLIMFLEYKLTWEPLSYATAWLDLSKHFQNPNEITKNIIFSTNNIAFPTNLKFE